MEWSMAAVTRESWGGRWSLAVRGAWRRRIGWAAGPRRCDVQQCPAVRSWRPTRAAEKGRGMGAAASSAAWRLARAVGLAPGRDVRASRHGTGGAAHGKSRKGSAGRAGSGDSLGGTAREAQVAAAARFGGGEAHRIGRSSSTNSTAKGAARTQLARRRAEEAVARSRRDRGGAERCCLLARLDRSADRLGPLLGWAGLVRPAH
ncbi:hypothetical protein E2562_002008 [Oryza meyeriana var. granulata]|uniref:Uncharacterized protein n=1 Tax=Oryza meyeriana var. granulata TaxID=110450 RepID=A0A6G1C3F4_9ORYZ|nr:hypothetical protein E2562_002008 [Oryza meyeriana var. granulata]